MTTRASDDHTELFTPELVIWAYENGYFPMADEQTGDLYWHAPDPRAIIPLDAVKVSRSLRKVVNSNLFEMAVNRDFEAVIRGCADRESTWISEDIIQVYMELHRRGFAHSVATYLDGKLVGGLYGMQIGGAFFGESMFSIVSEASKVAFVHLTERLREQDFLLLDSQYINPHMESLGAIEISRVQFMRMLDRALQLPRIFH